MSSLGYSGGGFLHPSNAGFTVKEFLDQLCNNELSDLFMSGQANREDARTKLLPLINAGMLYAYAMYKIKLASTQVMIEDGKSMYQLTETNILSITRVLNSYGRELEPHEVQIAGTMLVFPYPRASELQVEYKVTPMKLTTELPDETVVLELPALLIPWLRLYVAGQYLSPMKTEAAVAKSNDFLTKAAVAEQIYVNTNTTHEFTGYDHDRLSIRGFV